MERSQRPLADTNWIQPQQHCELMVVDIDSGVARQVYESRWLFEAPNWDSDGKELVINGDGRLWRVALDGAFGPARIDTAPIENLNNDHLLDPNNRWIYLSANDGHLYKVPRFGGRPLKITHRTDQRHYLHGISPDGTELAYVALERVGERLVTRIATISAEGGDSRYLTDGACPVDGPEYSPDGAWIYFNSEAAASAPGHAQIFRMRTDGSDLEQLTFDERVNWFPHLSPDGEYLVYLSYPAGTVGHPANRDVELRLMGAEGGAYRTLDRFNGGQGTINVNSWNPDSRSLAYVRYPFAE